jgi:hypothetical protein
MLSIDYLAHAQQALLRADLLLAKLVCEVNGGCEHMSRPHRCHARGALAELRNRNARLRDACRTLCDATADAAPGHWRTLLQDYEDYLDAWQRARCELAREEYLDDHWRQPGRASGWNESSGAASGAQRAV